MCCCSCCSTMPEVKGERRAYLELTHREHAEEKFAFLGVFQTVRV